MKSILIIIDYFGKWPEWFPLFLESCKRNSTINWLFHTDCPFEEYHITNVKFKHISLDEYAKMVSRKLKVNFSPKTNYKLCDLKPMYGVLHSEEISGFDFYGFGDLDVIYGNIRQIYTNEVLQNTVISTHEWCISGHLALFRNVAWLKNAFKKSKKWKALIEDSEPQRFDEDVFSMVFRYPSKVKAKYYFWYDLLHPWTKKYRHNLYLKEQFTTPLTPSPWRDKQSHHPEVWYWKEGTLTNEIDGDREYLYLHFMNYVSARWIDQRYNQYPCWKDLNGVVFLTPEDMATKGMIINRSGFHVME